MQIARIASYDLPYANKIYAKDTELRRFRPRMAIDDNLPEHLDSKQQNILWRAVAKSIQTTFNGKYDDGIAEVRPKSGKEKKFSLTG